MVVLLGEKTTDSSSLLLLLHDRAARTWIWTGVNMINSYAVSPNGVHGCRPPLLPMTAVLGSAAPPGLYEALCGIN